MKQAMTIAALVVMFLNVSLAETTDDKGNTIPTPVPEVIKCEDSNSCEMTEIGKLPNGKEEEKTDKK